METIACRFHLEEFDALKLEGCGKGTVMLAKNSFTPSAHFLFYWDIGHKDILVQIDAFLLQQ